MGTASGGDCQDFADRVTGVPIAAGSALLCRVYLR